MVGGRGVPFVSPVDGDQGCLVVGVKRRVDIYGCGREVGRPGSAFFVEGGLNRVVDHNCSGLWVRGLWMRYPGEGLKEMPRSWRRAILSFSERS